MIRQLAISLVIQAVAAAVVLFAGGFGAGFWVGRKRK